MEEDIKVRENRLRRAADRQGLRLKKNPRRDPRALDYGLYALVDGRDRLVTGRGASGIYGLTLDEIETYLSTPTSTR